MSETNGVISCSKDQNISRAEVYHYLDEMSNNIIDIQKVLKSYADAFNIQADAINIQAEVLGLLRYTIGKYLPEAHLAEAALEYKSIREAQINGDNNSTN